MDPENLPQIELHFSNVEDALILDLWVFSQGGQQLKALPSGPRQFSWRSGAMRLVLPLVRLARWSYSSEQPLPQFVPLLEGVGRANAAASFGDFPNSANRVKWLADLLSFANPPEAADAASRLREWFQFENSQGKRADLPVRIFADTHVLPPESVKVFFEGQSATGERLDQLEARLSRMTDGGSLPPWPWGGHAEIRGYIPCTAAECHGREAEIDAIDALYDERDEVQLLVVTGNPGEGKTTVAREWVMRRCFAGALREPLVFGWSFYRQGHGGGSQLLAEFWAGLAAALKVELNDGMLPVERAAALVEGLKKTHTLLFLDGLEVLLDADSPFAFGLVDEALAEMLEHLAKAEKGWAIVTSRESLRESESIGFPEMQHLKLSPWEKQQDFANENRQLTALEHQLFGLHSGELLDQLTKNVLAQDHTREIDLPKLVRGALEQFGDSPERVLLLASSLFDRPPEWECLRAIAMAEPPLRGLDGGFVRSDPSVWEEALLKLQSREIMILQSDERVWVHPKIVEIIADEIHRSSPLTWVEGHRWLSDWFSKAPKDYAPKTILEMEPLFRAMWHGLAAGDFKKAFEEIAFPKLFRGNDGYLMMELGAYQETLNMTQLMTPDYATFSPGCDLRPVDRALTVSISAVTFRWLGRLELAYKTQKRAWELIPHDATIDCIGPISVHMLRCQHIFGDLEGSKPVLKKLAAKMLRAPVTAGQLKVTPVIVADAIGYIGISSVHILRARGMGRTAQLILKLAHGRVSKLLKRPVNIFPGFGAILHGMDLLDVGKWREVEIALDTKELEPFSKRHREVAGESLLRGRVLSAKALIQPEPDQEAALAKEALELLQNGLDQVTQKRLTWWQAVFLFAIAIHHARHTEADAAIRVAERCRQLAIDERFRLIELDCELLLDAISDFSGAGETSQKMNAIGYKPKVEVLLAGIPRV